MTATTTELDAELAEARKAFPYGTRVEYWTGERKGPARKSKTTSDVWRMDAGQLVVKVRGQAGGIALTHIEKGRPGAPALEFRRPLCPLCGEETSHDGDSFTCEPCGAYWPTDHDEGEWYDDDAEQCEATHQPFARNEFAAGKPYQFETVRCMLDADHAGKHRVDSITTWTDETAVNEHGPAVEVAP